MLYLFFGTGGGGVVWGSRCLKNLVTRYGEDQ